MRGIVDRRKELVELEIQQQLDEFKLKLHDENIGAVSQEINEFLKIQKHNQESVDSLKSNLEDLTSHYKDLCLDAVRRELEYQRYEGQITACESAMIEVEDIYNNADKKLKEKIGDYNERIKEVEKKRRNRVEQLKRLANEFESKVGKYQELKVELAELDARIQVLSNVVNKVSDLGEKEAKCKKLEQTYQKMLNHYKQTLSEGVQEETRALIYSTHIDNLTSRPLFTSRNNPAKSVCQH